MPRSERAVAKFRGLVDGSIERGRDAVVATKKRWPVPVSLHAGVLADSLLDRPAAIHGISNEPDEQRIR